MKDAITIISVSTDHEEPPKEATGGKGVKSNATLLIKSYSKLLFWETKFAQLHITFPAKEISFIMNKDIFETHDF